MHIRYLANKVTSYTYIVICRAEVIHTFYLNIKKHTRKIECVFRLAVYLSNGLYGAGASAVSLK